MALIYKGDGGTPISSNVYPEWAEGHCLIWVTPSIHAELMKDEAEKLRDDLSELLANW